MPEQLKQRETLTESNPAAEVAQPTRPAPQELNISERLSMTQQRYIALTQFKDSVLRESVDYGIIPGTKTATLLQPGAQKLLILFGLHAEFEYVERVEDWTGENHGGEPFFRYLVKCKLYDDNGRFTGESSGEVNSWENRYRWRWVAADQLPAGAKASELERKITADEQYDFAIEKAQVSGQYGRPAEYWEMWKEAIKDGAAQRITKKSRSGKEMVAYRMEAISYRVQNEDVYSQVNTMIKIAQKRALVGATINATGASEFFTQDLEDMSDETLENMGIRPARTLAAPVTESKEKPEKKKAPTRQARNLPSAVDGTGTGETDWRSGKGAQLAFAIRKASKLDPLVVIEALENAGESINAEMEVSEVMSIVFPDPDATATEPDDLPF